MSNGHGPCKRSAGKSNCQIILVELQLILCVCLFKHRGKESQPHLPFLHPIPCDVSAHKLTQKLKISAEKRLVLQDLCGKHNEGSGCDSAFLNMVPKFAFVLQISSNMDEDDADQSVLIVGYEKPWLDRSAISIDNSFVDDIDESVSKVNHISDHENLADEGEQELKQLKESQVKSKIPACLASSREKSQSSQDQHEYNQSSTRFSRESSRESQESVLSGRSSRGSDGKRTSKDAKSRSNGEKKSQLTNENPQKSSKKQEGTRHRSSLKTNKKKCSDMER